MPINIISINARLAQKDKLSERQVWRLEFRKRFLQGSTVKAKNKASVSNPKSGKK
ncbi:hypothetical protein M2451_002029 [Dysgonomonas sp. PFB1-18]|uniref:hypothetical protein n=1 Tax=unclassified Dysgonomonas TaxID=2630389 RepID=UPI0024759FAC|nr:MULTISPECIES: hypothetical protein [unclassified Dysgonomonas]MDH6309787.1 hypothetical protein [Dysgonomonas sp. PF1-14]MDH6339205.1 hypothetical protein [Dysgonomonas sp. PF1-16]MDH6380704.1 hypothetical protein [Dysgonomonas sp. PFB1-18]MDH6398200.1 hypothetical protein [Dysgonomonas sp. PF1-23]